MIRVRSAGMPVSREAAIHMNVGGTPVTRIKLLDASNVLQNACESRSSLPREGKKSSDLRSSGMLYTGT